MNAAKIDETRLKAFVAQGMTDKQIGIVVGLSRRHVCYLRNLFIPQPPSTPEEKTPAPRAPKVTTSPKNHPDIEALPDTSKTVRTNRLDKANDAFAAAMCGRGHTSLNIKAGPIRRLQADAIQGNGKSSMALFESF